jgi:hypothetical protein
MRILATLLPAVFIPWMVQAATWTGAVDRNWFNTNNWDTAAVPGTGAAVTVPTGKTVLLTNETAALASFTMAGGTLTFSNWTTRLRATEVALDAGTLTLPPAFSEAQMSNRVWIVCSNFTLAAGAIINAQGCGYLSGQGEGTSIDARGGAGHGGSGGGGSTTTWAKLGKVYGDPAFPLAPGSGGGPGSSDGKGGGSVWIQANGAVRIEGTISVRGNNSPASSNFGAGSGGSVLIQCLTFHGSGTGLLNASGGNAVISGGRGGGGRLAVIYDTGAQALLAEPNPPVRFQAAPGTGGSGNGAYTARPGTLYLPDTRFLSTNMPGERWLNVVLVIPAFTQWTLSSLKLGGKIGFMDLETIQVAGDLTVTNGGSMTLFGGPDHPVVTGAGQVLTVGGRLDIETNAMLAVFSDDQSGVAPYVECGELRVQPGGLVSGDWYGYGQATGDGAGSARSGAGYGGRGSSTAPAGATYGVRHALIEPGSGGGATGDYGGRGGGLIRVSACGAMRVDGTISARGMPHMFNSGDGSGGGVMLTARSFSGGDTGLLRASGSGGGGGGRIAVWTPFMPYEQVNALAAQPTLPAAASEIAPGLWHGWSGATSFAGYNEGTIFFGRLIAGTLFMIR